MARSSFSRHVSSIAYHESLDLFVLTEGDGVVLRTPSGCDVTQAASSLPWPHDAVLLPLPAAPTRNRSALASDRPPLIVFVAQLDGKRVSKHVTSPDPTPEPKLNPNPNPRPGKRISKHVTSTASLAQLSGGANPYG